MYIANLFHALLTLLLFFKQFALTADITSVALGSNVFANLLNGFASDNFGSDGSLNSYIKLLTGQKVLELLTHSTAKSDGIVGMSKCGEGIDGLAIEQNVEFDQIGTSEAGDMIIERRISL